MSAFVSDPANTGLEVLDLRTDLAFAERRLHVYDAAKQMEGMQRLAHAFVDRPENILQELVEIAVELCGADSAGISIEREDRTDANFYHWVATAGEYTGFLDAVLPRYPSACGICLERGNGQHFTVAKQFFDLLGVEAPLVTDGILLPWRVDETRGTIFVMAHGRTEAFDQEDYRLMKVLADFAAMGFRQQKQQKKFMAQAQAAAAAAMANELAHKINNPLQSLTNVVYLATQNGSSLETKALANNLEAEVKRLSELVSELLALQVRV